MRNFSLFKNDNWDIEYGASHILISYQENTNFRYSVFLDIGSVEIIIEQRNDLSWDNIEHYKICNDFPLNYFVPCQLANLYAKTIANNPVFYENLFFENNNNEIFVKPLIAPNKKKFMQQLNKLRKLKAFI